MSESLSVDSALALSRVAQQWKHRHQDLVVALRALEAELRDIDQRDGDGTTRYRPLAWCADRLQALLTEHGA